jgi:hypothetical protein
MNVRDLIALLMDQDLDLEVVMPGDAEADSDYTAVSLVAVDTVCLSRGRPDHFELAFPDEAGARLCLRLLGPHGPRAIK